MTKRQKLLVVVLCLCTAMIGSLLATVGLSAFASSVGFTWGDVNGDGKITSLDLATLRRYLADFNPVTGTSSLELGPKCNHVTTDTVVAPTCTERGYTAHVCSLCGKSTTDSEIPALGHDFAGTFTVDVEPTRASAGSKSRHCTRCDAVTDVTAIPALGTGLYYVEQSGSILFGTYPQSRVTDSALIAELNSAAGTLPDASSAGSWTSCNYYIDGKTPAFMWYRDVAVSGDTFRGVYFTQYRPYWTDGASSADTSWQDDNGFAPGSVYWFRFEPIRWRKVANGDGAWLLLCDMILDSREFNASGSNSYADSAVRAWLNDAFAATAFTADERAIIRTASVPNSASTTNPDGQGTLWNSGKNDNVCADTRDGIFLLSVQEATARGYGFSSYSVADVVRTKSVTDYAAALGAYKDAAGVGWWWLRSPDCDSAERAHGIYSNGFADCVSSTADAGYGIVPSLWLEY